MNLEGIMLSEISQTEDKYCMISLICGIQKENQTHRYREQTGGCQLPETGDRGRGRGR